MIVSVGYEGRDLASFIELLQLHGVTQLVDVRLRPSSRKPGFSKTPLSEALEDAGMGYVHLQALGNPQDNREAFRAGNTQARDRYRARLDNGARGAVKELIEHARCGGPVAMLCFERRETHCHRSIVAQVAQEIDPALVVLPIE